MTSMTDERFAQEEEIRSVASRQHGVITRAQLLSAGISPKRLTNRIKVGEVKRLHRGVFLVGPPISPLMMEMAAVLACGGMAVLSYASAGALWAVWPTRSGGMVEVSIAGGRRPRIPGVRVHRLRELRPDEVTVLQGIPVTTAARTLLDLAGRAPRRDLERALARALRESLVTRSELETLLGRYPARAGTQPVRSLLAGDTAPAVTRSEAEERFLALIRRAQLTSPESNVEVCGHEVDFFWGIQRLIAEIDGFAFHSSREMFESDRRRDAVLAAAGMRVIRITWRQLQKEPEAVLVRVALALAKGPGGA
jgi:very-short-patch-repair endonuclease